MHSSPCHPPHTYLVHHRFLLRSLELKLRYLEMLMFLPTETNKRLSLLSFIVTLLYLTSISPKDFPLSPSLSHARVHMRACTHTNIPQIQIYRVTTGCEISHKSTKYIQPEQYTNMKNISHKAFKCYTKAVTYIR